MTKEEFKRIKDAALASDNPEEIKKYAEIVTASKNMQYICDFPEDLGNEKLTREVMEILENGALDTKDPIGIYEFMFEMFDFEVENFDRTKFDEYFIKLQNPKFIHYIILWIPGTNVPNMMQELYKIGNEKYIEKVKNDYGDPNNPETFSANFEEYPPETVFSLRYCFSREEAKKKTVFPKSLEKYKDYKNYKDLIIRVIHSKNTYELIELADHLEYIINYKKEKDPEEIKEIEQGIVVSNIIIKDSENDMHVYEAAWTINSTDKEKYAERLAKGGNAKLMHYFKEMKPEKEVIEILNNGIKSTGNEKYISQIAAEHETK